MTTIIQIEGEGEKKRANPFKLSQQPVIAVGTRVGNQFERTTPNSVEGESLQEEGPRSHRDRKPLGNLKVNKFRLWEKPGTADNNLI